MVPKSPPAWVITVAVVARAVVATASRAVAVSVAAAVFAMSKLRISGTNVCDHSCAWRPRIDGRGAGASSGDAARMARVPQARKPLSLVETRAE